ncbi:related to GTPase-activating protein beta-chimerin [Cephalotrichum gorgonifer]|uniref:Related to GTPase-activating protein beta-chimerin n=1 Tax=Cephalotrichum gorgonifer TaxID=2041049 RepID=A0AAE8MNC7_9PEZI|nr:related to GTPase-activating protein beta-chimerin [Cephalotrichum gorgonifer]
MSSAVRNRSEDRAGLRDTSNKENHREKEHLRSHPSSFRDNGGTFLSGLKSSSTRAAGMIRDGLFGKAQRTGTSPEKEVVVDDEHYVLKVINLPLVEQTRKTRISKRLEDSRDKTEFWMPAFPWRAIDYLNYKGCDVEGLYRVPGSGPQIKKWQRKFDEEYDVDLFAQDDLYDINIIGSMLKAWLRELPDELFPKEAQDRISRECAGAETVPQLLIDELANLSPFNYYLLFAITCHLSLLLAHSDKNKMDFRNLCICFQPCMKIDVFCFKFLVCDWRECWKGCKNESKYIEEEYLRLNQAPPRGLAEARKPAKEEAPVVDDQAASASDVSLAPVPDDASTLQENKKDSPPAGANGRSPAGPPPQLTINSERAGSSDGNGMRPLSPIMPLSPLKF